MGGSTNTYKTYGPYSRKGLAAHWKYKGIKSEGNLDAWMNNVRDILEAGDNGPMEPHEKSADGCV